MRGVATDSCKKAAGASTRATALAMAREQGVLTLGAHEQLLASMVRMNTSSATSVAFASAMAGSLAWLVSGLPSAAVYTSSQASIGSIARAGWLRAQTARRR